MKKILLPIFLTLGLFSFAQVQRTVLIEEFTNASCGPCASQNPAFNITLSNNANKVVTIKYQTSFPGVDPMNAQNASEVATRFSRYKFTGVPSAVIDGDTFKNPKTVQAYAGAPFNIKQALIDKEYALTSPLLLSTTYSYDAVKDSITSVVTVTNKSTAAVKASALNNLKLMFVLMEMNINYAKAPGTNGETDFFYVMRKMYPNQVGTQLPDSLLVDSTYSFTFKIKPPAYIYKKNQMAVAAFVQDFGTNFVHQSALGLPPGVVDLDAALKNTVASTNYCAATITNPKVVFTNKGNLPITSAKISLTLNGTAVGTPVSWMGNLAKGQSDSVTLANVNAAIGVNNYKYSISDVNTNAVDLNDANNLFDEITTQVIDKATKFVVDFENGNIGDISGNESINNNPGGSFIVDKNVNTNLTQKLGGFGLSDKSYRFNFYNVPETINLGLVSYKHNLTGTNFDAISFDYAYNNYFSAADGDIYDGMAVKISNDCGATWTEIWKKNGADLKTVTTAGINTNYYPLASSWKTALVAIPSSFRNIPEFVLMMEGQSGFGNNLYIDNVNITKAIATNEVQANDLISVYPNPTSDKINIVGIQGDANISLIDIYGRTLKTMQLKNNVGTTSMDVTGFVTGNYLLKVTQDNVTSTKSIMIK